MFASGCQAEWNKMPIPGPPVTIGIYGGYVRSWTDRPTNSKRRLHKLLIDQGIATNQEVIFMSDGACNLRDLQYYMRPNAEHVLDYFHITMRITVFQQIARGLPPSVNAAAPAVSRCSKA